MGLIDKIWQDLLDENTDLFFSEGSVYVGRASALKAIRKLSEQKKIEGFEGFAFDGQYLTALPECIADFSALDDSETVRASKEILDSHDFQKAQFIELVLG